MSMKIIAIHRGRNKKTTEIVRSVCSIDYNFDFRGFSKPIKTNLLWLLLKAHITSREIPKADVYLLEGGLCFWVGYFLKKRYPSSKLVLMAPEPLFYLDERKGKLKKFFFQKKIQAIGKTIDHLLPVSPMVLRDAKKFIDLKSYALLPHFLMNFYSSPPKKSFEKNLLFIIERPIDTGYVKGLDIAIQIFENLYQKDPEVNLYLVGSGTEYLKYPKNPNIFCLGFKEMKKIYEMANILIVPARYDAFPLVVPEAALAGAIPLVSSNVGTKDDLSSIEPKLVIDSLNPQVWTQRICELFNMDYSKRKNLHEKFCEKFEYLKKENILTSFQQNFKDYLNNISERALK